jgi:hypothetical protein
VITTYLNDPCDLSSKEKCDPKKLVRGRGGKPDRDDSGKERRASKR